VEGWLSG